MVNVPKATKSRLIYWFEDSRDLFNNPLDIDLDALGYSGDLYDFELIEVSDGSTDVDVTDITFNSDVTNNYRQYFMQGLGGSSSGGSTDSTSSIHLARPNGFKPALMMRSIMGSSGDERRSRSLAAETDNSGVTRLRVYDDYWKNTADPIESIQINSSKTGTVDWVFAIFATPKDSNQETWELMNILEWSSESSTKSFTGLDGDVDIEYRLIWSGDTNLNFQLNASGTYARQRLTNTNGSLGANNQSSESVISSGGHETEFRIFAESGKKRIVLNDSSTAGVANQQERRAQWCSNTADPVTSIDCTPPSSSTGTAQLYRKRTPSHTADILPWETVEEIEIDTADFTSGHTFSNIKGDSQFLIRVEFLTEENERIDITLNGITSSDYIRQYLQGDNSSVSSSGSSSQSEFQSYLNQSSTPAKMDFILYPKSGDLRPVISSQYSEEDNIRYTIGWLDNTADEIDTIEVSANSSGDVKGTLRFSKIPRIQ